MIIASIASSSNGNCIFIEEDDTKLLVDVGLSKIKIERGLSTYGISPETLDGILITHDHSDHIKGLGVFLRKYNIPVYATMKIIESIFEDKKLGKLNKELFFNIEKESKFSIKNLLIHPITVHHDATDSVCYRFDSENKSCAVVTDLGTYDVNLLSKLKGLDAILIESNHDEYMLRNGDYPEYLKERILGDNGHLSNETCAKILCNIINPKMKHIILGHLSKDNNKPEIALKTVKNGINPVIDDYLIETLNIQTAKRMEPSCFIEF